MKSSDFGEKLFKYYSNTPQKPAKSISCQRHQPVSFVHKGKGVKYIFNSETQYMWIGSIV